MAKKQFRLPADIELDLSGDGLVVRYDGDVVLEQTFGRPLAAVEAGGDLTLSLPVVNGTITAGGKLEIAGDVDADTLTGGDIVLTGGTIKARAISASSSITIGAADLKVDVILAPQISMSAGAKGRVTVIESANEREPNKIKGGFSLAEYEELFGDSSGFLAERGVAPLGGAREPARPARAGSSTRGGDDELTEEVDESEVEAKTDQGDEISLADSDLQVIDEDDELFTRLADAVGKIVACYQNDDAPPSVVELQALVVARDLPGLKANITEVWNGLLGHHQQRGIRLHHQVTHAFNVIHGLLQ